MSVIDVLSKDNIYHILNNNMIKVKGMTYLIEILAPPGHRSWASSSSEHTVLYGRLKPYDIINTPPTYHWVVFKLTKILDGLMFVPPYERRAMKRKYHLLWRYCRDFSRYCKVAPIKVNRPRIVKLWRGDRKVWMEDYIPNFRKFWGKETTHITCMVTSDIPILRYFQYYIYQQSQKQHTVIDLQGGIVNGTYILCDVEFTDTYGNISNRIQFAYLNSVQFMEDNRIGQNFPNPRKRLRCWWSQFSKKMIDK